MGDATGQDDPEAWREGTEKVSNSWWTDWVAWLDPQCGDLRTPPPLGNGKYPQLIPAPGNYILEE